MAHLYEGMESSDSPLSSPSHGSPIHEVELCRPPRSPVQDLSYLSNLDWDPNNIKQIKVSSDGSYWWVSARKM